LSLASIPNDLGEIVVSLEFSANLG